MLPQKLTYEMMLTQWAQELNPLLKNPITSGIILKSVSLVSGNNVVNHLLGRKLQGWYIVRIRSASTIYDTQDSNQTPQLTLNLVASAPVIIDLAVF